MKKLIAMIALFSTLFCGLVSSVSATDIPADDGLYHGKRTTTTVWDPQSDNEKYPQHRIPGIVVTKKDTVIIYCEARTGDTTHSLKNGNDWCLMDIYIQRSEDGGKTFGDPIYIAKGNRNTACVNNPVMIVGNDNTLHMLYCKNYSIEGGGLWYRKSTDDGLTWTEEREISKFAESTPHDCFAFGPTHGISTRDGVLMTAIWLVPKGAGRDGITAHGPNQAHVFYSEDNGETWKLTEKASSNPNETAIAELSDGSIILNSRSSKYRKVTTSPNGISGWTATYSDEQLPDPGCCGGMVTVDIEGAPYAHLFVNCANQSERTDVTLRVSFDDCVTWEKPLMIDDYFGGYSDVAVDSKGKIYVLYERSMGARMNLFTCSFVDEFLNDADNQRVTTRSEFVFANSTALSMTGGLQNLEESIDGNVLRLVATNTKKHGFAISFKELTENLNLTRKPVMALKMRVNTDTTEEMKLAGYVTSGRIDQYTKEKYWTVNVPANGEWQTVLVDMSKSGIEGDLVSIRFELFADTLTCKEGDSVDLEFVKFYENEAEARRALGLNPPETEAPSTEAPAPETGVNDPQPEPVEKKGCGASTPAFLSGIVGVLAAIPTLWKRKKKD
ncbi:MAG: exo-alpha-sialidase [Ruminococcaceae bacterium]|nr:exo-alpha-sialidase [Oscillospiraceae bacterium]